jgi:hypothetical protein
MCNVFFLFEVECNFDPLLNKGRIVLFDYFFLIIL